MKSINNAVLFIPYSFTIHKIPQWIGIIIAAISGVAILSVCIATLVVVARNQRQNAEASVATTNQTTMQISSTSKTLGEAELERD